MGVGELHVHVHVHVYVRMKPFQTISCMLMYSITYTVDSVSQIFLILKGDPSIHKHTWYFVHEHIYLGHLLVERGEEELQQGAGGRVGQGGPPEFQEVEVEEDKPKELV